MRYVCVYAFSVRERQTDKQFRQVDRRGIFGKNRECVQTTPHGASGLQGLLNNQFGDDLTSVVDLADANTRAIHWDLEEFLVVR